MKRFLIAAAAALVLSAVPASAGLDLNQLPSKGALIFVQLPDGTYASVKANANGGLSLGASAGITQLGYQQITSLATAQALTVPTGATFALIVPETKDVRWRPDGSTTAPTASVGMPLAAGQPLVYSGDLAAIRFIEQAASAKLNIFYGK